jgi:predicted DNA-binding transcriptional regulator YafY
VDRLFRIVAFLKSRCQAVTAETLAAELEVSVRTIYRDMADLESSGVPNVGETGVGYALDRNYTLCTVRPLCLAFFGPVGLLSAWCETREDFRNFRLDRMRRLAVLDERFADERGKRLADFMRREHGK